LKTSKIRGIDMSNSQKLYKKAKEIIPGGTQLLSKRPETFLPELWPAYYEKAKGCDLWDLDKNRYIDMSFMGIGSCILGYADKDVNKAVKLAIDKAFGNKDLNSFIRILLLGGGVFVLNGSTTALKNHWEQQIRFKINFDLNKKVFRHLQDLSFNYFQDKSCGEHLYKISSDIERTADFIVAIPPGASSLFLTLLFTLVIIFYLNWRIALFSSSIILFLYLPSYYFIQKAAKLYRDIIHKTQDIFKVVGEIFSHIFIAECFPANLYPCRYILCAFHFGSWPAGCWVPI